MQPQKGNEDVRLAALTRWVAEQTGAQVTPVPASADASFRRYFRVTLPQGSRVVMDAPPEREDSRPFVDVAGRLARAGVAVPAILAADLDQGFLLLSDMGRQTWLETLTADNADASFRRAIATLIRIQQADTAGLPVYDEALLRRELALFPDWFLQRHLVEHLGLPLDIERAPDLYRDLAELDDLLVARALAQPQVFVHRDYMPRNLMQGDAADPGVLDFQDAVRGPISYDAMSLFKDAFLSWPEERVLGWLQHYWDLPVPAGFDDFLLDGDLMGAQRHLKVIGIFARICHRDGKPKYLADVPRFFRYLRTVAERRAQLAPLIRVLDRLREAGVPGVA
ncbi:hypothetical protein A167_00483 [Alcanivorax sp. S71-1-4]|uniref:aminoglycoside phosphotransferase family protein n=1 Tax=Alcanivorax sp. S71-1-4 TaxID=1177159 RepID=UPI001358FB63|nr:phosphotransferase [Alcanivorax sp. S71-1-4]KAF0810604.1 hypothetical protein A167_00483 [Alcanivorax sp. S71-1-4]